MPNLSPQAAPTINTPAPAERRRSSMFPNVTAPAAPPTTPAVRPRPSAPPPGVAMTPELAAMRQRIIDRVADIGEEDYFKALGLERDATDEALQHAYISLAKVWHPDRLAPQLFDVHDLAGKVFLRMTEARNTLLDPEKRAAYLDALSRGQRPDRVAAARASSAIADFEKAEGFLKRKNLDAAEQHARNAHEAEPANAAYLALLTSIEIERDPAAADHPGRYMEALDRAVKLDPRCERAFMARAALYRRSGKPEKAYADFKEAAAINPKNIDAMREVMLHRKRAGG
jgi:curved DNA-binding protein CbpA